MKKLLILVFVLTFFVSKDAVLAAPTPAPTADQTLIEQLGNEIASKTAQLNLVEKRGIIGTVTDSSNVQITLTDPNGNTRFVDVDELTKFSSSSNASFGISDITNGTTLGVLGLYNKQSRRILGRDIQMIPSFPNIVFGEVSAIDKVNYEVTVLKGNGGKTVIEIQDITKTSAFTSGVLTKSGFSKIQGGQTVSVTGFPDKQDPNKIMASQIIILSDIQLGYNLNPVSPTIIPSTGSGIKLYPLKK
ncbi:MAG: hypothetical protein ABSD69_00950 [Candidatus Levyibacteriota bacterium]|jgi:hypothetical protein